MREILCVLLLTFCVNAFAQKPKFVSGEYRYVVPENVSIENAKSTAVEKARLEAMAAAFNTTISQTNVSTVKNSNGVVEMDFSSFGGTEVKGIWLGDQKEPELTILYENDTFVVIAKVWGHAREIKKSDAELNIMTLCNGVESVRFANGSQFSMKFKSAINGYLAIFLMDDNLGQAYCLMPYENTDGVARKIKRNVGYEFLSKKDSEYPYLENTILTASKELEYNRLSVVFSPNEFSLPLGDMGEFMMELPLKKFSSWLHKSRIKDVDMQVIDDVILEIYR